MEERTDEVPLPPAPVIGIVYNLKKGVHSAAPDAEAEYDNIETVYAIRSALEAGGCSTVLLEADETLCEHLRTTPVDMVFNIAEGLRGRGREGQVPALLEMLGVPYTGSDATALCVSLDKAMTKRLLSTYGVRTPGHAVCQGAADAEACGLHFPIIVKPNAEGSSKGVSDACVVRNAQELRALLEKDEELYHEPMLAEEYIAGREFTVGILGNGAETRVFSPMEIIFRGETPGGYQVYNFTVKQDYKRYIEYQCPPRLDPAVEAEIVSMARTVYDALGCRDFSRVDFRLSEDGTPYFIEINPLPGLAPGYSDYPMLADFCGVPYDELVRSILAAAAKRCGIRL